MKIEDFRPIRSQDSAPIKFDWLLTQESDWIIWTNQKITLIIFWLVKNGKDWNPAIPLVKRIFLVPDHIWPKTIKGQPALTHVIRNYVLLLVVPPLCLWWVTHSDESAQAQNSSRATTTLVSQPPHSTVQFEFSYDDEMMHIAWCCLEEVPYCFSRSSVKFQGHTALKIVKFDLDWAFPDCNSSLNSPMATKWCTKLEVA